MKSSGTSRRPNVTTSPRRDVPTSRHWGQLTCKSTSGNVATSQRRDVATSRRQYKFCFLSIKSKWRRGFGGVGRRTNEGTEFQSRSDTDFEEVPVICIVSHYFGY